MIEEAKKHSTKPEWTKEEDDLLSELVKTHGTKDFLMISQLLKTRGEKPWAQRWYTVLRPRSQDLGWTEQEDQKIIDWVRDHGENDWKGVKSLFPGRKRVQIEFRWKSTLRNIIDFKSIENKKERDPEREPERDQEHGAEQDPDHNKQVAEDVKNQDAEHEEMAASPEIIHEEDYGEADDESEESEHMVRLQEGDSQESVQEYEVPSQDEEEHSQDESEQRMIDESRKRTIKGEFKRLENKIQQFEEEFCNFKEDIDKRLDKIELRLLRFVIDNKTDSKVKTSSDYDTNGQLEFIQRELTKIESTRKASFDRPCAVYENGSAVKNITDEVKPPKKSWRKRVHISNENWPKIIKKKAES